MERQQKKMTSPIYVNVALLFLQLQFEIELKSFLVGR